MLPHMLSIECCPLVTGVEPSIHKYGKRNKTSREGKRGTGQLGWTRYGM